METIDLLKDHRVIYYGFEGQKNPKLSRLNSKFESELNEVNPNLIQLGRHTSGILVSFETDSQTLIFDVSLSRASVMKHMTILAESGIDLYLVNGMSQTYYQSFGPEAGKSSFIHKISFQSNERRHCLLYFPLYNGIERFELQHQGEIFSAKTMQFRKKIAWYGTSITQGACASRPGLSLTALISRKMNIEFINYGFSGNGLGENAMIEMIASINDLDAIVIDYEANSGAVNRLISTLNPMLCCIRKQYPKLPIIIMGRIPCELELFDSSIHDRRKKYHQFYVDTLNERIDPNLYYFEGETYFPMCLGEVTVDGIHLNDLGFNQMANHLVPYFEKIILKEGT